MPANRMKRSLEPSVLPLLNYIPSPKLARRLSLFARAIRHHRIQLFIATILLWLLIDTDSYILWFLRWTLISGPSEPDPLLTHQCPSRNYSLPLVVVIPLISSQVPRLEWTVLRWARADLNPCQAVNSSSRRRDLAVFFDRPLTHPETATAASSVRQLLARKGIADVIGTCFHRVTITSANLTNQDSKNGGGFDFIRSMVTSRGSNLQYEAAFHVFGGGSYRHMWFMEPDTWPIRPGWLDAVDNESRWGDFWVRGTIMRYAPRFHIGWEPFRSTYLRHINGNAIYALDDKCFDRFRELVTKRFGDSAYDVARAFYLMGVGRILTFQTVAHRFQVSRVVADLGVMKVDEETLVKQLVGTYLVHAKQVFMNHRASPFQ